MAASLVHLLQYMTAVDRNLICLTIIIIIATYFSSNKGKDKKLKLKKKISNLSI